MYDERQGPAVNYPATICRIRDMDIDRMMTIEGARTWGDLARLTARRLLFHRGITKRTIAVLRGQLVERGLDVGMALTYADGTPAPPLQPMPPRAAYAGCPTDAPPAVSGVYFVRCDRFIKIGIARDIKARLAGLQTSIPFDLELLGYIAAEPDEAGAIERRLHGELARFHYRGEWFLDCPQVRETFTPCTSLPFSIADGAR